MLLLMILQWTIAAVAISISTDLSTESQHQPPVIIPVYEHHEPGMTPPTGGRQPGGGNKNTDGGGDYGYNQKLPGLSQKPLNRTILRNSTTSRSADADGIDSGLVFDNDGLVFGQRCRQVTLLGGGNTGSSILQAACIADGRWWQTTLNLSQCIALNGRHLVFDASGNYDRTCRPCGIDADIATSRVVLRCTCLSDEDGTPTFTELLLVDHDDSGITSVNGRLVCGGQEGTKSPSF